MSQTTTIVPEDLKRRLGFSVHLESKAVELAFPHRGSSTCLHTVPGMQDTMEPVSTTYTCTEPLCHPQPSSVLYVIRKTVPLNQLHGMAHRHGAFPLKAG